MHCAFFVGGGFIVGILVTSFYFVEKNSKIVNSISLLHNRMSTMETAINGFVQKFEKHL